MKSSWILSTSWPESNAPVLVAAGLKNTRGGDSIVTSRVAVGGILLEEDFGECSPPRDSLLCESGILTLRSSDASEEPDDEGVLSEYAGRLVLDERRLAFLRSVEMSKVLA